MVDHNLNSSLPQLYPLHASCVMVPLVPVFREDRYAHEPYSVLDEPFIVDIGIVAAIRNPQLTQQGNELRLSPSDVLRTRACIRNFFVAARQVEAQALVLVPLGCGAFCNPPGHICEIFLEVIGEFDGAFEVFISVQFKFECRSRSVTKFIQEVVFAILDDKNTGKAHNPEGNLAPFKSRIERRH
jgi:uncharacterized protein (TIGR02452 family)